MSYLATLFTVLSIIIVIAFIFWGIPMLTREKKPSSIKALKERYGEPPGLLRSLDYKDLGWPGMPGNFEGNSASSVSAHILRSAN
jgi:hypothetical protein